MSANGDFSESEKLAGSQTSTSLSFVSPSAGQVDLTEIDGGLHMLLERSRGSLNSCKEAVVFLKSRAKVEEDYGRALQKAAQQTVRLMDNGSRTSSGMSTQQAAWQRLVEVHEPLAANRMKFAITLFEMSEYLGNYVKTKENVRRKLRETEQRYQRAIEESQQLLEKAKTKYDMQCAEWEKLLVRCGDSKQAETTAVPSVHSGNRSAKNAVSGIIFGKHKPTLESLDRICQEAGVKAKVANEAYKRLLQQTNAMRRDFYDVQQPKILASVMGLVEEVDQFLKFTLGKYAYTYESAVLADAITLKPMDAQVGMVEMVGDIDSKADLDSYVQAMATTARVDRASIPYREYRMSPRARLYANPRPIFGVSLHDQLTRDARRVPLIMVRCTEAVEAFGLQNEGIYRQSGQSSQVQRLRSEFDLDAEHVDLHASSYASDINNIASVLKMYLRELPGGLVPHAQRTTMLAHFSSESNSEDELELAQKISGLAANIREMPQVNRDTLRCLLVHLDKVQAFQEYNMMNSENLSIVFGPTILPPDNAPSNAALDIRRSARMVKFILDNRRAIFDAL
ncbi:Rho GTPase-activating protein [Coemansia sp. RSA 2440]|nr:Rho GTPase-activating protein [Coemansia sp. RSA 2440]KAJ2556210.1 Rho GTPase-activating protein [Coemansia sp. RSA 1878]